MTEEFLPPSGPFRAFRKKPDLPPSYQVHIAPTAMPPNSTSGTSGPGYWAKYGFELKALIGNLYGVELTRIDFFDPKLASERLDVALVLPETEDESVMKRRIQEALKQKLNLSIAIEKRPTDVYVVTAPEGGSKMTPKSSDGGFSSGWSRMTKWTGPEPPTREELDRFLMAKDKSEATYGFNIAQGTVSDLCYELEKHLDRLMVDETHVDQSYHFQVHRAGESQIEFFNHLRNQFGLVMTPSRRDVDFLVVRPIH